MTLNSVCGQTRCDTTTEFIWFITEVMPKPNISMTQVESILNKSIDLSNYAKPVDNIIYLNFIINCKGEDCEYKILNIKPIDRELENQLISIIKSNLDWTPAMQKGEKVDIQMPMKISIENNCFNIIEDKEKTKKRKRKK